MIEIRGREHFAVIGDEAHFYSESSVAQLANGEVLVTSPDNRGLAHTDAGSIVLSRSADGGRTWQNEPRQFIFKAGATDGFSCGPLAVLADGTLICHADHTRFLVPVGDIAHIAPRGSSEQEAIYVTRSSDGGHTWADPWPIRIVPMRGCYVKDSILELPDGGLLMPLSGARHSLSHKFPPNDDDAFRSYLVRSDDRGDTWYFYSTIALDPAGIINFWEPTLTRLASGRLIALLRMDYVHMIAPPGGSLFYCYSDDDGASWSVPQRTPLWGYPADLIVLRDGRLLATYGYRQDPLGIRLAVSENGLTWTTEQMTILREIPLRSLKADGPNFASFSPHPALATLNVGFRHIGYPSTIQLAGGQLITVYHLWNADLRQCVEATVYELV